MALKAYISAKALRWTQVPSTTTHVAVWSRLESRRSVGRPVAVLRTYDREAALANATTPTLAATGR